MINTWSDATLEDLRSLHAYVSVDNPTAVQTLAQTILNSVETNPPDHPHLGRNGRENGTRELVISNTPNIIPYHVKSGVIQSLRLYHRMSGYAAKIIQTRK